MSFRIKQQINFLKEYFFDTSKKIIPSIDQIRKIIKIKNNLIMAHKNGKKIMVFGNGGSASIASHFSVDLTKNAKLRGVNYNEADLITCFSNDYGYERWVEMAIKFYGDKGDILIVISTSGMSKNIINGIYAARKKKFKSIITFTGHNKKNSVSRLGDINMWVDSKAYNIVENIHQTWLLSIVDLIIGKKEYPPN